MQDLKARIARNLAAFERRAVEAPDLRRAAVAILLAPLNEAPAFVLTRRALTMRRNAGTYALPGGNCDPGEDAVATAIRELREEIGVDVGRDAALGLLDDFTTLGGHCVTPVVLWSDTAVVLRPDPSEVHAAWLLPLAQLDHPGAPRREPHPDGGDPILSMFVNGDWINPPTAAWLYQFREVALRGLSARVHAVGQPAWTAR